MADIQSYERVIKNKSFKAKIFMIFIYALILLLGLWALLKFGIKPELVVLIPLLLGAIIALTWRYTQVEYEYSFMAGTATFSKIFGNSSRRTMVEFDIKSIISFSVYDQRAASVIESDNKKKVIHAVSKDCKNPCVCVFENDSKEKTYLILDCDELTARIFKFFASAATDKNVFDKLPKN
jgi:uncharacterized membrane protein